MVIIIYHTLHIYGPHRDFYYIKYYVNLESLIVIYCWVSHPTSSTTQNYLIKREENDFIQFLLEKLTLVFMRINVLKG